MWLLGSMFGGLLSGYEDVQVFTKQSLGFFSLMSTKMFIVIKRQLLGYLNVC